MPPPVIPIDAIRQPAFVYRPEGIVEAANDLAEALVGRPLAGMTPADLIARLSVRHRDGTPLLQDELPAARALRGEEVVDVPLTVTAADGRTVHVLATASPIRNSDTVAGALAVWQEMTDQVRAEAALATEREEQARRDEEMQVQAEELQAQNEELRVQAEEIREMAGAVRLANADLDRQHRLLDAVLGVLPYSVSLWDRDEVLLWANEVFFANRTVHRDDLVGRSWVALGDDAVVVEPLVREGLRVFDDGAPLSREVEVPGPGGTEWRSVTVLPFGPDALLVVTSDITGRKRAEEAVRASERVHAFQSAVLEAVRDPVWATDPDLRIAYWNDAATATFGWTADEVLGRNTGELFRTLVPGSTRDDAVAQLLQTGDFCGEAVCHCKDGRPLLVEASSRVVRGPDGEVVRIVSTARDITERKRAEEALRESRQQYQSLIETNVDFVWETDAEGRYTYCSPQMETLWGLKPDEMVGRTPFDLMPVGEREQALAGFMELTRDPRPFRGLEACSYDGRGNLIAIEISGVPYFDDDGAFRGYRGITRDVTGRKRTEEAEARLRALMDHNPCLVFLKDEQGRYVYLNQTYEERFVHSADWCGKTDYDFWPKESAELFRANDAEVLASGQTHQFLENSTDLDGTRYVWLNYKFPFVDAQGRRYVGGVGINATARVRAEEALARSEAEYRHIVEYAPTGIYELDYAGPRFRRINDAMCEILGYTRDELLAMDPGSLMDEESRERFRERVQTVLAGEPVDETVAYRLFAKDGREIWGALNVKPIFTDGRMTGALVVAHDVTERKHAEEALRVSEEQFRRAIEDAPIPIIMHAEDGQVLQLSRTWTELTGYGPEDLPTFDAWLTRAYGEGADAVRDHVQSLFSGDVRTIDIEFPVRTRDGRTRYWSFSASSPGTLLDGRRYVVGMAVDITERNRAKEALREREQTLQSIFRAAPVGIGISTDRVIVSVNASLSSMTGYAADELLGQPTRMLYPSDDEYDRVGREKYGQIIETGLGIIETQWQRKDGGLIEVLLSASPMDRSSPYENVVTVAIDLTPLREREAALRESEAKYRNAVELSPDAILIHQDGTIVFANPAATALVGVGGPDALVGRQILDLIDPGTRELVAANIDQDLRGEQTPVTAIELRRDDGTTVPVQGRGAAIPFGGRPAVQVVLRDVTEERQAELALRASKERYRELVEQAGSIILRYDRDGHITFINEFAQRFFGYAGKEIVGRNAVGTIIPEVESSTGRDLAEMVRDIVRSPDTYAENENENITRNGRRVWVRWANRPIVGPGGEVREFLAIGTDITERKAAEEALAESEAKYRGLFDSLDDGFCIIEVLFDEAGVPVDYVFLEANPAFVNQTGIVDPIGRRMRELEPAHEEHWFRIYGEIAKTGEPRRFVESAIPLIGGWYEVFAFPIGVPGANRVAILFNDITERKKADKAMQESEARQGFLIRLNDALAPLADPVEVQETAERVLAEYLGADRVAYFEVVGDDYVVERDYAASVPHIAGRHPIASFGHRLLEVYCSGTTAVGDDVEADPDLSPAEKAGYRAIQIGAYIGVPLVKDSALVAGLAVHMLTPREWTPAEVALVEETAERTWSAVKRAQAEAALREYAENLRRSNEDLERFAYVASHDLQEPLRGIVSFSQLLDRRYKGRLGTDADEYIDFIVEGGSRMQGLILDLLAFSRVNTTRQQIARTDVEDVLAEAVRTLDISLQEAGATLTHDPLPVVMADPVQLLQVFSNLVSNAIKFRKPDVPLHVHVGARRLDGFWEFSVRDNGIGIEKEYYDKIFVIFQRLHTKETYPGTGIGLAIVKRIIDRHGGTIRVESTPGEGTTFSFTLPAA